MYIFLFLSVLLSGCWPLQIYLMSILEVSRDLTNLFLLLLASFTPIPCVEEVFIGLSFTHSFALFFFFFYYYLVSFSPLSSLSAAALFTLGVFYIFRCNEPDFHSTFSMCVWREPFLPPSLCLSSPGSFHIRNVTGSAQQQNLSVVSITNELI